MGLNVFTLFVGFGLGSFLFGELLRLGFGVAFSLFAGVEFFLALLSLRLFRSEVPAPAPPLASPACAPPLRRDGDTYVVNGERTFITSGITSDHITTASARR